MLGGKPRAGETPISDWSCLKMPGLTTVKEVFALEGANIRKATLKYLGLRPSKRLAPFDYTWVKRLHGEMFCDVWTWAGKLRTENLNIGTNWQQIEQCLCELLKDLEYWANDGMDIHEQAVMLHHKAVSIHPFSNGNGRWSRMLEMIWLNRNTGSYTKWPEVMIENNQSPVREEYLAALKQADNGYYSALLNLHNKYNLKQ